jgi:hypothetical protein
MTVPALEPVALSISPVGAEVGEGSMLSTPDERLKFQRVG